MDNVKGYDFAGWVTRNDVKCSDGRIIRHNAFKDQDGTKVPLVWMHQHGGIENVLGNVLLQNRPEGVYGYGSLNDSEAADMARIVLKHDDVTAMSIFANNLTRQGNNVIHGTIREVSLVLAGANPGATIDEVVIHEDGYDNDELIFFNAEDNTLRHSDDGSIEFEPLEDSIVHADDSKKEDDMADEKKSSTDTKSEDSSSDDKTLEDIFNSMTEEQKTVVYALVGQALEQGGGSDNDDSDEEDNVKHNVFDNEYDADTQNDVLVHDAMNEIIAEAKNGYSMKKIFNDYVADHIDDGAGDAIAHAATYGVDPVDYLFPDAKTITPTPEFIRRDTGWVSQLMNRVHHTPFSRIKSVFADITADEARARGYMKGKLKKEEVFTLLKRSTSPTTIYKKQKMDRDDVIDITDFNVIAWLKGEMRGMLDEEIARAVLVGDGRMTDDDDHISEEHIRPIWKDAELYTIQAPIQLEGTETPDDIVPRLLTTSPRPLSVPPSRLVRITRARATRFCLRLRTSSPTCFCSRIRSATRCMTPSRSWLPSFVSARS